MCNCGGNTTPNRRPQPQANTQQYGHPQRAPRTVYNTATTSHVPPTPQYPQQPYYPHPY